MDAKVGADYLRRLTVNLPESLLIDVEETLLDLRKRGRRISFSGLVEVALRELIPSNDLAALIKKHGASARRQATIQAGGAAGRRE